MDQIRQLQNNIRQTRQNLNSVLGQVNQQLQSSEQIAQNIGTQLFQRQNQFQLGTGTTVGTGTGVSSFTQTPSSLGQNFQSNVGTTGQFAQNQSSMQRGAGVNQYGAHYSSGNRDEDVSQSYYQSPLSQPGVVRSQYNPQTSGTMTTTGTLGTTGQFTRSQYKQPSMQQTGGVNQYGARYSSGNRDEDVSQSYYQSTQGTLR